MRKIFFSILNFISISRFIGVLLCSTLLILNCYAQWIQQNSGTHETLNSIDFCNALTGFCAGSSGTILKTTNGKDFLLIRLLKK